MIYSHSPLFILAGVFSALMAQTVRAELPMTHQLLTPALLVKGEGNEKQRSSSSTATPQIPRLQDLKRPATTVKDWLAQVEAATVQVTRVQLNRTDTGLEIVLETPDNKPLQVDATKFRSEGNSLVADIPNAVLALSEGQEFTADNPTDEIANVRITQLNASNIRITVAGKTARPTQEVTLKTGDLAYSLNSEGDEPDEEIVVTGEQDGYRVPNTSVGTRTDTPLRDIPQSIQVIPRQVIEDQEAQNLTEALKNVAGIVPAQASQLRGFDEFLIRGFSTGFANNTLRNGLVDRTNTEISSAIANIERIEVLKGPASVLYGQGSLGGTINIVTKQPLSDPRYELFSSVGNFSYYSGGADFSGPLNRNQSLLYRLTASVQNSDSFVDFANLDKYFVSPVLTWKIGQNTALTVDAEYLGLRGTNYSGIPAVGTVLPNSSGKIPINRSISDPANFDNRRVFRAGYRFEHRLSENWQFRSDFRASLSRRDYFNTFPLGLSEDGRFLERGAVKSDEENGALVRDVYNLDNYTIGKFNTGRVQHQLVTGFNLSRDISTTAGIRVSEQPLDLFNPVYGTSREVDVASGFNNITTSDTLGFYVQDLIAITDNFKILLGGRFDIVSQKLEDRIDPSLNSFQQNEAFSPRVGIVYQPIQPISLYTSYGRSFQQNIGRGFDGQLFEPERGTQYEVGVKADLTSKLSATLAFYQLTRTNVLTSDPINLLFSIVTGEQRSRGIEFDLGGEILPGWKLIASYAYTNARLTKDEVYAVGNRLNNVPEHAFSLWTTYEIQKGFAKGFGGGLGLFYVGDRQGDLENSFGLPGYLRTDAAIFYKRDRFKVALNINNLFNAQYFETGLSILRISPGAPFTVKGTVSWQF